MKITDKELDSISGRYGSQTPLEDMRVIADLAERVHGGIILETGTCGGASANTMARASTDSHVFTVDSRRRYIALDDNVTFLEGDSKKVVQGWDKPIDLLFIDGGHDYETVKSDFFGFGKYVKNGGIIILHDYGNGRNADVATFVHDTQDNPEYKPLGKKAKMIYLYEKCHKSPLS